MVIGLVDTTRKHLQPTLNGPRSHQSILHLHPRSTNLLFPRSMNRALPRSILHLRLRSMNLRFLLIRVPRQNIPPRSTSRPFPLIRVRHPSILPQSTNRPFPLIQVQLQNTPPRSTSPQSLPTQLLLPLHPLLHQSTQPPRHLPILPNLRRRLLPTILPAPL